MFKSCFGSAAALLTVAFACLGWPPVHAQNGSGSALLKKHGLRIAGTLAVVDEEAEVKSKLTEARRLLKQLSYSLMQQQATLSPQEIQQNIKTINDQINQLRSEVNAANQQMNSIPKYRNRFMSADGSQLYQQLASYKAQLQMEISQDSNFLNQLKSQPPDPKAKEKIDSEVRDRREAYHQALLDLRKLVDSAREKYEGVAKDDEVKKALDLVGHGLKEKPKLGPSHDFLNNVKLLEKLEAAESTDEKTEAPHAKTGKRSRHGTKAKTSKAGAATGSGAGGDSGVSP